ncbi:MAG: OmpA family protein [candidate division WOR-3 bacterium]|nr:OmpA family protein [candidate division WOR-3 bacterium]
MRSILFSLLFIFSLVFSQYSFYPTDGLFLMKDAEIIESGKLRLGTYFLYYPKEKEHYFDLSFPTVVYSLTDFLEIGGYYGRTFYYNEPKESLEHLPYDGIFSGKISIPFLPVVKLGAFLSYPLKIREKTWNILPIFPFQEKKLAYSFLLKLKFSDLLSSFPSLLVEKGYFRYNNIRYQTLGLGVLISAKKLSIFGELFIESREKEKIFDFDRNRIRLTPGFNIFLGELFNIGFSVSKRLNELPELPDWQYNLSLSFSSYFLRKPPKRKGVLTGRILDFETKLPLLAKLTIENFKEIYSDSITGIYTFSKIPEGQYVLFVEKDGYYREAIPVFVEGEKTATIDIYLKPILQYGTIAGRVYDKETNQPLLAKILLKEKGIEIFSDSITGGFRIDNIETGIYTIEAIKDNYFPYTYTLEVKAKEVKNLEIPLAKKGAFGTITGQVFDYKEKKPLKATVEIKEANVKVETDTITGIYKLELPVGTYTAIVSSEGYIAQTSPIIVEKDKAQEKNFYLVKKGMVITLRGIYFDFNKATIKKESYPTLDSAAQILKDNPKIIVEIQGHTDNIGDAEYNKKLSLRRAQAVVNYFVQKHGIDIRRLRATGYGEEKPIADNATEEGRALNRRVEFVIIKEE